MLFFKELNTLFYDQMNRQTSAYLYGSVATGNWVAARSDLDLLGEKIKNWKQNPGHPILDGFAIFLSQKMLMAKRLEEFQLAARPFMGQIQVIDRWNIKNRSKHLFGQDFKEGFPDVSVSELSEWARKELRNTFGSLHSGEVPKADFVLSKTIWSVSWSARMLMLARGIVCDSKQEALRWFAQEYPEIHEPICLLLEYYPKSDSDTVTFTADQDLASRRFCLELMRQEAKA